MKKYNNTLKPNGKVLANNEKYLGYCRKNTNIEMKEDQFVFDQAFL